MKIGTTFDIDQAESLNLDWKETLERIIDLKLEPLRIGIKWSRVERQRDKYNWSDYDHIFSHLAEENIEAILSIGIKVPRWPEFYIPEWLEAPTKKLYQFSLNDKQLVRRLFDFEKLVLDRYGKYKNIKLIQVENEPFILAGDYKRRIARNFLKKEVRLIRQLTKIPILQTMQALPTTGIIGEFLSKGYWHKKFQIDLTDVVGFHVYPIFEQTVFGNFSKTFKAGFFAKKYLHHMIKFVLENQKELLCTELQAEPWESGGFNLQDAWHHKTINPDQVSGYIDWLEELGIGKILLWGIEFHIASEAQGNKVWIEKLYKNYI